MISYHTYSVALSGISLADASIIQTPTQGKLLGSAEKAKVGFDTISRCANWRPQFEILALLRRKIIWLGTWIGTGSPCSMSDLQIALKFTCLADRSVIPRLYWSIDGKIFSAPRPISSSISFSSRQRHFTSSIARTCLKQLAETPKNINIFRRIANSFNWAAVNSATDSEAGFDTTSWRNRCSDLKTISLC